MSRDSARVLAAAMATVVIGALASIIGDAPLLCLVVRLTSIPQSLLPVDSQAHTSVPHTLTSMRARRFFLHATSSGLAPRTTCFIFIGTTNKGARPPAALALQPPTVRACCPRAVFVCKHTWFLAPHACSAALTHNHIRAQWSQV